jgi:hypothetical protein
LTKLLRSHGGFLPKALKTARVSVTTTKAAHDLNRSGDE